MTGAHGEPTRAASSFLATGNTVAPTTSFLPIVFSFFMREGTKGTVHVSKRVLGRPARVALQGGGPLARVVARNDRVKNDPTRGVEVLFQTFMCLTMCTPRRAPRLEWSRSASRRD